MQEERRRYFRIDDSIGIAYRCLGEAEAKAFIQEAKNHSGNFDFTANFDNRIHTLLDACKVQSPIAAEILDLLNKKINFMMSQMDVDADLMRNVAFAIQAVNISACGMSFANDESLSVGQVLQVDIVLHPSELHLVAIGKVVQCSELAMESAVEGKSHFLRVDFTEMSHTDQELLIQHVVKKQSEQLKQRRFENQ